MTYDLKELESLYEKSKASIWRDSQDCRIFNGVIEEAFPAIQRNLKRLAALEKAIAHAKKIRYYDEAAAFIENIAAAEIDKGE